VSDPRLVTLWDWTLANLNGGFRLRPLRGEKHHGVKAIPVYFYPVKKTKPGNCEEIPTILVYTGYNGS
jgi:hypothetical protein